MSKILKTGPLAEMVKNQELLPSREEFKNKPGYWEKPAKVHRTGVGMVDGYEWGYRYKANDGHGKLTHEAQEVGEMIKPYSEAEDLRQAKLQGVKNRRERRARYKGRLVSYILNGKLHRCGG